MWGHDRRGTGVYEFSLHEGVDPEAYATFEQRVTQIDKDSLYTNSDCTVRIYQVKLKKDSGAGPYKIGDTVALSTCRADGYLAAMNVAKAFKGDKISTELATQCFSWAKERNIPTPHVYNAGGPPGAISYARGAWKAGYGYWSKSRDGPFETMKLAPGRDDIDKEALLSQGTPRKLYFSMAPRAPTAAAKSLSFPQNLQEQVRNQPATRRFRGSLRDMPHRTVAEIFGPTP